MASYTVNSNQSVLDVVSITLGDLGQTYALLMANGLYSLSASPVGLAVQYTPPSPTPVSVASSTPPTTVTAMNYTSQANQSLFDIVQQVYGGAIDLMYQLIQDSGYSALTYYPKSGTKFTYNPTLIGDTILNGYIANNSIILATASNNSTAEFATEDKNFIFTTEDGSESFTYEA